MLVVHLDVRRKDSVCRGSWRRRYDWFAIGTVFFDVRYFRANKGEVGPL